MKKKKSHILYCKHDALPYECGLCGIDELDSDQLAAVKSLCLDDHLFFAILASAGNGKSFLINWLIKNIPACYPTAMTGKAAVLISGTTLHSYAGISPIRGTYNSKSANARARATDLLIIDEISMATSKILDQLLYRFVLAGRKDSLPKVLVLGDFRQLPPIDGAPIFEHELWPKFKRLHLTKNHRQTDLEFIRALNNISNGILDEETLALFKTRQVKELPDDCTHVLPFRKQVEARNIKKLNDLSGHLYETKWIVQYEKGRHKLDNIEEKTRLKECLQLKENARIILTNNDKEGKWVNGSSGQVLKLEKGSVKVELDSVNGNKKIVNVHKISQEILDSDHELICTISQYPIKLGYADTTHGTQGSTMELVGVDIDGSFASGQIYVGFSRCRTLAGLFIKGELTKELLLVDEKALKIQRGDIQ